MTYNFHVDFDGNNWRCYETEDIARESIAPLSSPVFTADWDGLSNTLNVKTGTIPSSGIPFMGWPQQ